MSTRPPPACTIEAPNRTRSRTPAMIDLELLRRARWISLTAALSVVSLATGGCAPPEDTTGTEFGENDESNYDEVTDVSHTIVKNQSIGNCWVYATSTWIESLRKRQA